MEKHISLVSFSTRLKVIKKNKKINIQHRGAETYQIFLLPYRQISLLHFHNENQSKIKTVHWKMKI